MESEPAWTHTGKLLAVSRGIWSIDPVNGRKQLISGTTVGDLQSVSSTDERALFFTSWRQNQSAIRRMDMDGRNLLQVTHGDSAGRQRSLPTVNG
jgi:hypothetical protein